MKISYLFWFGFILIFIENMNSTGDNDTVNYTSLKQFYIPDETRTTLRKKDMLIQVFGFKCCGVSSDTTKKETVECQTDVTYIRNLFNYICNNLQIANTSTSVNATVRANCILCFNAATANIKTTTILTDLLTCANQYLPRTQYRNCITVLQSASINNLQVNPNTKCPAGYCSFVQCLRRANADKLINQCYINSLPGFNLTTQQGRVDHYLLTTSCILAFSRCNTTNPISGQPQNNRIGTNRLYNLLQVTLNGDLRVISFPRTVAPSKYLCQLETSLNQSPWGTIQCN